MLYYHFVTTGIGNCQLAVSNPTYAILAIDQILLQSHQTFSLWTLFCNLHHETDNSQ